MSRWIVECREKKGTIRSHLRSLPIIGRSRLSTVSPPPPSFSSTSSLAGRESMSSFYDQWETTEIEESLVLPFYSQSARDVYSLPFACSITMSDRWESERNEENLALSHLCLMHFHTLFNDSVIAVHYGDHESSYSSSIPTIVDWPVLFAVCAYFEAHLLSSAGNERGNDLGPPELAIESRWK